MFAALLDTCVLWPSLQRDFLLSLAVEGLYRPLWSEAILEELEFHERKKLTTRRGLPELEAAQRAAHLLERMREAFPDAVVLGWESLEGTYGLPDFNDEHVVAAAHMGGAGAIVTHNVKDFPRARVPASIHVLHPVDFLFNTVSVDPVRALVAVTELADRQARRDASRDVDWVLGELERRYGLQSVVGLIRDS